MRFLTYIMHLVRYIYLHKWWHIDGHFPIIGLKTRLSKAKRDMKTSLFYLYFPKNETTLVLRNALRLYVQDVPFSTEPLL